MALCECGCGQETKLIPRNRWFQGVAKNTPNRFIWGHHRRGNSTPRKPDVEYRSTAAGGRRITLHRLRAERALGKTLPKGAVVHHADGSKREDAPLVICQDERYHQLLHARMRVKAAGGDPNTDAFCGQCGQAKHRALFSKHARMVFGVANACFSCEAIRRANMRRKRESAEVVAHNFQPMTERP